MQRLRGSDAFAIYSETSHSPFVTLKVGIYEPTDADHPADVGELRQMVKNSISAMGLARAALRIVRVPLDLHHPVWVADPEFSPDDHIYHVSLPAPGGKTELSDFISDLLGLPLNPDRPLWEIWLVEGLEKNRLAVVMKIHHALADGKYVAAMIKQFHSTEPQPAATQSPARSREDRMLEGERIPGPARLVTDALVDLFKSYTVELPHYYRHLKQAREGSAALKNLETKDAKHYTAPWTILNQSGSRYRLYRYETFSLGTFKALAKKFDCTINSLILGVGSEAIKRYLVEVDKAPDSTLLCAVPVGDQTDATPKTLLGCGIHNNNLAVAMVPLFQNIDDFQERVQAIKRAARAAVDAVKRSNGRRFDNYLDFLPGTFIRMIHSYMTRRAAQHKPPPANVIISNVPGPSETLYACDGKLKLVELMSSGNLADAGSLNITVWSYVDNLCFSFYFRKGVLPQPERLIEHMREVVRELEQNYLEGNQAQAPRPQPQLAAGGAVG